MQSLSEDFIRELRSELISHKKWDRLRYVVRLRNCQAERCRTTTVTGDCDDLDANLVRLFEYDPNFWEFCSNNNIYPLNLWEFAVNTILDHDRLGGDECDEAGEETA